MSKPTKYLVSLSGDRPRDQMDVIVTANSTGKAILIAKARAPFNGARVDSVIVAR